MKSYLVAIFLLFSVSSIFPGCQPAPKAGTADASRMVFKSDDGGQSWQDISNGLPELSKDSATVRKDIFYANENGLYLTAGNKIYHNIPNATAPFWTSEIVSDSVSQTAFKSGTSHYKYWSINTKKADGTDIWAPLFDNNVEPRIRTAFETASGDVIVGTNEGFYKTTDNGATWKHVYTGALVGNLAEANGVLLATSMYKIIRSTDGGENWTEVESDTVAFDVKQINGGFAAITAAAAEKAKRRLMISYDGGKTWQKLETNPQNKELNDSIWKTWNDRPRLKYTNPLIVQLGENLYCIHPQGIFKSTDNGKKWKIVLPAIKDKVFNLFVSGNVIYAVAGKPGC